MFKTWAECVKGGFSGDEQAALRWLNSAFKNKEYRKRYNMQRSAILEMVKEDSRFKQLEAEAKKKLSVQAK